ncbi:hypothetical protein RH915_05945 [Serpentinicella sp. ANB-PHB4]|uniref:hypothetical protein n=1 Tax=Serpentinicella sp. ANB-PHB4 TaxID=3074076 RepID=UPI002855542B|nr:hypothetical protein [Serpentinicella sp. ANB-PHB4]MDR5659025.1 hypothetical protein [Serpentinicella sp. ANB-PHB4]
MNKFVIFLMMTYVGIIAGGFFAFLRYIYIREDKNYYNFKEAISKAITNDQLTSIEDIELIFNSVNKKRNNFKFKKYMQDYVVEVICEEIAFPQEVDDLNNTISNFKEYIKNLEIFSPFEKLPQNEKIICNDILSFIQNKDSEKAKEKLYSLSNMIYLREETVEKLKKANKYSIPIAIIGIILTFIFGIMSLIQI